LLVRRTPFLVVAAIAVIGCAPRDKEIRIERARAETRMLAASFDRLENRLLASQARVRLWRELKDRHESVSAIACTSQMEHAAEMAMHALPPAGSLHHARVAAAVSGPAKPLIRRSDHH
jgi:hypothetical protein